MSLILIAILLVVLVGFIASLILSYASKVFEVKEDETFLALRAELPGANCGGCGFAGCDDYGHALVADPDNVPCTKCSVGGPSVAEKIASILGKDAGAMEKTAARVLCQGNSENCKPLYTYTDMTSCKAAKSLFGGSKACPHACLGLGDCVKACEFNAIHVVNGIARVFEDNCTSCSACVKACPQHVIEIKPVKSLVTVLCSNTQKGGDVMKECKTGCIGCMKCQKVCPKDAITIENFLSKIDVEKCVSCGLCAKECPTGAILNTRVVKKPAAKPNPEPPAEKAS